MTEPIAIPPLPMAPEPESEPIRAGVRLSEHDRMGMLERSLPENQNIAAYEGIFKKCLKAAERALTDVSTVEKSGKQIDVAIAIFRRFYDDQNAMKQGKQQAEAMLQGLTQVLEGRR